MLKRAFGGRELTSLWSLQNSNFTSWKYVCTHLGLTYSIHAINLHSTFKLKKKSIVLHFRTKTSVENFKINWIPFNSKVCKRRIMKSIFMLKYNTAIFQNQNI